MGKNKKKSKSKPNSGNEPQKPNDQESAQNSHASGMHADNATKNSNNKRDNSQEQTKPDDSMTWEDNRQEKRGFSKSKSDNSDDKGSFKSRCSEPNRTHYGNNNEDRPTAKRFSFNDSKLDRRGPADFPNRRNFSSRNRQQDPEFIAYEEEFRSHHGRTEYDRVKEITIDLFQMPQEYSLAHCVAEDLNMGSGIAVPFRQKFKRVDELLNQRQRTGGLAILNLQNRFIYYLITKQFSHGKPTYETLFSSLKRLRDDVIKNEVKKIAMPRIGCGLDRLEWENVKFMVEFVFRNVDVEIVVCNLEPMEDSPQQKFRNCRVTHETYPIQDIENGTVILYFSSEDEYISDEMKKLDEKFYFLNEFRYARKSLGNVVMYTKNENYLLCGCIVRKRQWDPLDFVALQNCLRVIQKENRKLQFSYYAFQAFKDQNDHLINYKIINILRNNLQGVEVYVCWPGDLQKEMTLRDRPSDNRDSGQSNDWRNSSVTSDKSRYSESQSFRGSDWRQSNNSYENSSLTEESNPQVNYSFEDASMSVDVEANDEWFQEEKDQRPVTQTKPSVQGFHPTNQCDNWEHTSNQPETSILVQDTVNHEFESFKLDFESDAIDCSMLKEHKQPPSTQYSLVCYSKENLIVESGVPVGKDMSASIGKLLAQNQKEKGLAVTQDGNNFWYFLITSSASSSPTSESVFCAIQKLREHATKNCVTKMLIPIMENWGDGTTLTWKEVKSMFAYLLGPRSIDMILVRLDAPFSMSSLLERYKNELKHVKSPIHQMKKKSVIIYLASADGQFTEEMTGLAKKFDFRDAFLRKPKTVGDVIKHKENEDYVVYGCVVKKSQHDQIDFEALRKCLVNVNQQNQTEKLPNAGIQAVKDQDGNVSYKIITILLHCLKDVAINVCWPGDLKRFMPLHR